MKKTIREKSHQEGFTAPKINKTLLDAEICV